MQKITKIIVLIFCLSCRNPQKNEAKIQLFVKDSLSRSQTNLKKEKLSKKIFLKDTDFVEENSVIFLRPDDSHFEGYSEENGIYEVDSDFGFAISAALDTIAKDEKLNRIKTLVSTKRYIVFPNSEMGTKVIDRDTIDYGIIIVGKNKDALIHSGNIYGGDLYIDMIRSYFNK